MTPLDKALALAQLGLHVFPCREREPIREREPGRKAPYTRDGFLSATTDAEQIATWWTLDYPNALVGVSAGLSGLNVADMDRKHGKDGFAALTAAGRVLTPTFHYPTDSNGEHWIYRGSPTLSPTTDLDGMLGVDRRSGGSYIIWWADVVPASVDEFSADVPEWLLTVATKAAKADGTPADAVDHEGFDGSIEQWLDTTEDGPSSIRVREWLDTVPLGDFGHDRMVTLSFNLVRLGAEGESGVRQGLHTLRAAWLRAPYNTPENRKGLDDALRSAITKAGAREKPVGNLLPFLQVQALLPETTRRGRSFASLLFDEVPAGSEWKTRRALLDECFAANLSAEQAATVVWSSVAGRGLQADPNGIRTLWQEVAKAEEAVPNNVIELPVAPVVVDVVKPVLLTEAERREANSFHWFGTDYMEWAASRMAIVNAPYHRINRFIPLALVYGPLAYIPDPSGPIGLNLYTMTLGDTTTGKTKAHNLMRDVIRGYFGAEANPDLGGNMTKEALHRVLIERDGQPSLFRKDEADGFFAQAQQNGSYTVGLIPDLTAYYDGEVPPAQRQGSLDISGQSAVTHFSMYLMGTVARLTAVLDRALWQSGFLARYIWTVGEPAVKSMDAQKVRLIDGDPSDVYDKMPRQWAAEFNGKRMKLAQGGGQFKMGMDIDAQDRMTEFNIAITKLSEGHRHEDILTPSLDRFKTNILKCAMLIALSEGERVATLTHVLVAIEQAEEWLAAMLQMVEQTTASIYDRHVSALEKWISGKKDQEAKLEDIHRWSPDPKWEVEKQIDQLVSEARAVKVVDERTRATSYRLINKVEELAA